MLQLPSSSFPFLFLGNAGFGSFDPLGVVLASAAAVNGGHHHHASAAAATAGPPPHSGQDYPYS